MIFLVDYNLDGYAPVLLGSLANHGWLTLLPIQFVTFKEVGLSSDTSDRIIWRFAQANRMMLVTANRNLAGEDSLEQVMREEVVLTSLPVITIGSLKRLNEYEYREQCAERLIEIVLDLDNYLGVSRLCIP